MSDDKLGGASSFLEEEVIQFYNVSARRKNMNSYVVLFVDGQIDIVQAKKKS